MRVSDHAATLTFESRIIELHIRAVQKAPQIGPFWVLGAPIPQSSCLAEISKKLNETDYLLFKIS